MMVQHVQRALAAAERHESKLPIEALQIEGMSSPKVRHLLNSLCAKQGAAYLEIGLCRGSTFIGALYGNDSTPACGIDNWSEFGGPRSDFFRNLDSLLLRRQNIKVLEMDCFRVPLSDLPFMPSIYFYDGSHTFESQYKALTYFWPILADQLVYAADDWNCPDTRGGTRQALSDLKAGVVQEWDLPARFNGDTENWWNGVGLFVLEKR